MAHKLFILFGATGSLARLKIFPALSNLYLNNELKSVKILAYGRKEFDSPAFRKYLSGIQNLDQNFINVVDYLIGNTLDSISLNNYISVNKIEKVYCYLALPPNLYPQTIDFIGKFMDGLGFDIALEKPFGTSLTEANNLANKINNIGSERFYLVDHYLAREAVINLPTIDIDSVSIIEMSILEESGVDGREAFYDQTGATIDTVQNHILNTLSKLIPNFLNNLKYKQGSLVLGQYDGYKSLPGINPKSKTETYFKAEFKYKNVQLFVRSGKAMNETKVFISIVCKSGKVEIVTIKPNPNEVRSPHEHIIKDFLDDKREFRVSVYDALLSWDIIDKILAEIRNSIPKTYVKGSNYSEVETV